MLLAAGASRRFGADKRAHTMGGGQSLLHTTIEKYIRCFEQVVVVLRPDDQALADALVEHFGTRAPRVVIATNAALGMGHSLAAGIAAIDDWDHAFIALADMPFVQTDTIEKLKAAMAGASGNAIIQPTFNGRPGHPVGFGHHHFAALLALSGDAGARSVVMRCNDDVVEVAVQDQGVIRDVDKPADLDD